MVPIRWSTKHTQLGRMLIAAFLFFLQAAPAIAQANVDGGRSELPGMKQDMFDQVQRNKKGGPQPRGKGPPDCPKSDMMSPFYALAFANQEVYVRINSTEGKCQRLISVGGANYTDLINASRTCGPAGEWKRRIAENMSSMFFQGGYESWVRSSNETIEVITEDGTFQVEVTEEKYIEQLACWKYACGCEQAANPTMRYILTALLIIAGGGISYDSLKFLWNKLVGKKPPKHVICKNGHRMEKVKLQRTHYCDMCSTSGTLYQCGASCNYDMCEKCYKEAKKKVKAAYKEWLEKHPEEKSKKDKDDDKDDDKDEDEAKKGADSEHDSEKKTDADTDKSEPETTDAAKDGENEEDDEKDASNAEEAKDAGDGAAKADAA